MRKKFTYCFFIFLYFSLLAQPKSLQVPKVDVEKLKKGTTIPQLFCDLEIGDVETSWKISEKENDQAIVYDEIIFKILIKNSGTIDISDFKISISRKWDWDNQYYPENGSTWAYDGKQGSIKNGIFEVKNFKAGETKTIFIYADNAIAPKSDCWFNIKLDPNNEIAELNEENNSKTEILFPSHYLYPDLKIEDVYLGWTEGTELPKIYAIIKNTGKTDITTDFQFKVVLNNDENIFNVNGKFLETGKKYVYDLGYWHSLKPKDNIINIILDFKNDIQELNENNNFASFNICWNRPEVSYPVADLEIIDFNFKPGFDMEGKNLIIDLLIKNNGNAKPVQKKGESQTIVQYRTNKDSIWETFGTTNFNLSTIEPGEEIKVEIKSTRHISTGMYQFRVILDRWAVINNDIDYTNNINIKNIFIKPSPIKILSIQPFRIGWGGTLCVKIKTAHQFGDITKELKVKFNDIEGSVTNYRSSGEIEYELFVSVPEGATTGPISVSGYGVTEISESPVEVFGMPLIESITPQNAPIGTEILICGKNFVPSGLGEGTSVYFNSWNGYVEAIPFSINYNELKVKIPYSATTGPITISTVVSGLKFSVTSPFIFHVLPKISFIFPAQAHVDKEVGIYGSFGYGIPVVEFNGKRAEVLKKEGGSWADAKGNWAPEKLVVKIPEGATSGNVRVTNDEGEYCEYPFRVLLGPLLTSILPSSGPKGTVVTLKGVDLDLVKNVVISQDGWSAWAEIIGTPTEDQIQIKIPLNLSTSGLIYVSVRAPGFDEDHQLSNKIIFELTD